MEQQAPQGEPHWTPVPIGRAGAVAAPAPTASECTVEHVATAFELLTHHVRRRQAENVHAWLHDAAVSRSLRHAALSACDARGETLVHKAVRVHEESILRTLLRLRADPNTPAYDTRQAPLHLAAEIGAAALVELLLLYGGDPQQRDRDGRTPLSIAQQLAHPAIVEALQRAAATRSCSASVSQRPNDSSFGVSFLGKGPSARGGTAGRNGTSSGMITNPVSASAAARDRPVTPRMKARPTSAQSRQQRGEGRGHHALHARASGLGYYSAPSTPADGNSVAGSSLPSPEKPLVGAAASAAAAAAAATSGNDAGGSTGSLCSAEGGGGGGERGATAEELQHLRDECARWRQAADATQALLDARASELAAVSQERDQSRAEAQQLSLHAERERAHLEGQLKCASDDEQNLRGRAEAMAERAEQEAAAAEKFRKQREVELSEHREHVAHLVQANEALQVELENLRKGREVREIQRADAAVQCEKVASVQRPLSPPLQPNGTSVAESASFAATAAAATAAAGGAAAAAPPELSVQGVDCGAAERLLLLDEVRLLKAALVTAGGAAESARATLSEEQAKRQEAEKNAEALRCRVAELTAAAAAARESQQHDEEAAAQRIRSLTRKLEDANSELKKAQLQRDMLEDDTKRLQPLAAQLGDFTEAYTDEVVKRQQAEEQLLRAEANMAALATELAQTKTAARSSSSSSNAHETDASTSQSPSRHSDSSQLIEVIKVELRGTVQELSRKGRQLSAAVVEIGELRAQLEMFRNSSFPSVIVAHWDCEASVRRAIVADEHLELMAHFSQHLRFVLEQARQRSISVAALLSRGAAPGPKSTLRSSSPLPDGPGIAEAPAQNIGRDPQPCHPSLPALPPPGRGDDGLGMKRGCSASGSAGGSPPLQGPSVVRAVQQLRAEELTTAAAAAAATSAETTENIPTDDSPGPEAPAGDRSLGQPAVALPTTEPPHCDRGGAAVRADPPRRELRVPGCVRRPASAITRTGTIRTFDNSGVVAEARSEAFPFPTRSVSQVEPGRDGPRPATSFEHGGRLLPPRPISLAASPEEFYRQQCVVHHTRAIDRFLRSLPACHGDLHAVILPSAGLNRSSVRPLLDLLFVGDKITQINLSHNLLPDGFCDMLYDACVAHPSVNEILLDGNLISAMGVKTLAQLCIHNPNITRISVKDCKLLQSRCSAVVMLDEVCSANGTVKRERT